MSKPTQDQEWRRRRVIRAIRRAEEELELLRRALLHPDAGMPDTPAGRVPRELGGHALWLTAKLAAILDLLLKANDWTNAEELLKALREQSGGVRTRRALSQAVYRLNGELEASGLGRRAIKSYPRLGYRLARSGNDG